MAFQKVATLDDVWEGEMASVELDGHEVLLVCSEGGRVRAFQGVCPHQDIPLVEGTFNGTTLVCRAHQWVFDATTGVGINPGNCRLAEYPVQLDGDDISIDIDGISPLFAVS